MAKTTQAKFFELLEMAADEEELQVVIDHRYANMGTFSIQSPGSLRPLLRVDFNFQSDGCKLGDQYYDYSVMEALLDVYISDVVSQAVKLRR